VLEADIKAHLQAFAARFVIKNKATTEKIQFVDGLAKTSVGKIDKRVPRQTYGQAAQRQPPG